MITEFQVLKYKVKYFETQLNIERCNIKYYKQDCIQSSRLVLGGLFLLSISGVLGFLILWATGDIDPNNAHFGYMEG